MMLENQEWCNLQWTISLFNDFVFEILADIIGYIYHCEQFIKVIISPNVFREIYAIGNLDVESWVRIIFLYITYREDIWLYIGKIVV